ncbi:MULTISPECIES: dihydrolipoamide acetyltransferase family protein [Curtobacterium]|jgi:pyruvate dehydrogenase E2 component (dihydrolipoamide acetyltransferase)|uniref:dihydrolipoamide acetyltransferase family protein n=1 Tax=Curtobacterium TaxID=2034 RepID=UPI000F4AA016|nr:MULTISPECIES: dihydrolipoamide acetyltransferase family protein [Curtobacterium]MBT1631684.1 2-oxo acid dehydrogenase subunit E2 [Curtobacterium flaccumfaciens pv. oortii]MCX2844198.1 dihydrolipoamide acetyltransferase family protein [Curtobacterium flaccumfaciens pv. oortii]ROP64908.1 pyruvate dehydrogenase E2 component (dihydrolipoamide acetyltransferase) [Curtobacterium sp. ZW137]ROQ04989.1 pyruvate dehydrogenase E2 component (dihydrolipoamide acetyltransferase) [Curtobacterium sp. PhB171
MIQITMPRLSDTMEEGAISAWHKHPGDIVEVGDILVEIETDKATMEYEAYDAGTLTEILVPEGENVAIGTPIATLDDGSGPALSPADGQRADSPADEHTSPTTPTFVPAPAFDTSSEHDHPARTSEDPPVEPQQRERSEGIPAPAEHIAFASPLARKLAREHHVDIATVHGSGPGGRLVRADVEAIIDADQSAAALEHDVPSTATLPVPGSASTHHQQDTDADVTTPMTGTRKVIARRLTESARTIPHFTVTAVADADALIDLRTMVNASRIRQDTAKVSLNDFIVKAAALALAAHPAINVSYQDDPDPAITQHTAVNIGIAMAAPAGLVVPVMTHADTRSVSSISAASRSFSARAADRKLQPADMTGGTFTVSNLGMFGAESFTAIINPPESAILAVGAATADAAVHDGNLVVRHRIRLTLSADHRVIDGALAAQYLQTLTSLLEDPISLLL